MNEQLDIQKCAVEKTFLSVSKKIDFFQNLCLDNFKEAKRSQHCL